MNQIVLACAAMVPTVACGAVGWGIKRALGRLDSVDATVVGLRVDVAAVQAQHHNNGGSTMRDAVDRIERGQSALTGAVDGIRRDLTAHLIEAAGDHVRLDDHLRRPL